ncbi:MAG: DUF72 domain-containing protein [Smithellaceae bacterium]|nr:DUF72 domain-containing protein [Smithellaceae bacterium]
MDILAGTSGYSYNQWKGRFYPEKMRAKDMLSFYARSFRTVEINNTFHRMPSERLLASWAAQVPRGFVFALKAPQFITHVKMLRNVHEETSYLFRTLPILNDKLGPVLFQFPPSFHISLQIFTEFLTLIPDAVSCAFEFRHSSWRTEEVVNLLRGKKFCLCVKDADDQRAGEIISTAPWGYLRLRRADYTEVDIVEWAEKIRAQKWERAFVFFKHEDGAKGPEFAQRLLEHTMKGK